MKGSACIAPSLVVNLTVNGEHYAVLVPPYWSLLDLLQRGLGLSVECRCDAGDTIACTVLLNGQPVQSCSVRAADVSDCTVTVGREAARAG